MAITAQDFCPTFARLAIVLTISTAQGVSIRGQRVTRVRLVQRALGSPGPHPLTTEASNAAGDDVDCQIAEGIIRAVSERLAYRNDLPGSRRAPCLGCGSPVVTARDAHCLIGGKRDGSVLIAVDTEPQRSLATDVDLVYTERDLFLL